MPSLTDTAKSFYAAFLAGDLEAIRAMVTKDVIWEYEAPAELATSGIRRSPDGIAAFVSAVAGQSRDLTLQMTEFLETGDAVAAFGRYQATVKSTGIRVDSPLAQYFHFRDGKISRLVLLSNTGAMADAILGHAASSSPIGENKKLIQDYFQALSGKAKTPEVVGQYVADEVLVKHIADSEAAFPNYDLLPQEIVSEGDLVVVRAEFQGVHLGPFAGIEPTGKSVSAGLIIIYKVQNHKIVNHWMQFDTFSLLQQLQSPQHNVAVAAS